MVLVDQRKRCWATHTRLHKVLACPAFDDLINAHYSKTLHKERHARHLVEQNQVERGDFVLHVEDDWHKVSGHKSSVFETNPTSNRRIQRVSEQDGPEARRPHQTRRRVTGSKRTRLGRVVSV